MLVLFIVMIFVIMGFAALVIDVGFARLAQRQMQTAVDAAALEGLRFRDEVPPNLQRGSVVFDDKLFEQVDQAIQESGGDPAPATMYDMEYPEWRSWTEQARRWFAQEMVQHVFRDHIDPEIEIRYGAGPQIEFEGGFGPEELAAGQTVKLDTLGVWKPGLQLNLRNHRDGDVVAWKYDKAGNLVPVPENAPRQELADAPALQVVLRRTNNLSGVDDMPDVSSHGPTIPFMFARATAIGKVAGATYSPREHGIEVRAIAIADARHVLSVGMPRHHITHPLGGLARFALALHYWGEYQSNDEDELDDASLRLVGGEIISETDRVEGIFFLPGPTDDMPVVIGREIPMADVAAVASDKGYVPIYTEVPEGSGTLRVIGFGFAEAIVHSGSTVTITPHPSKIAAENASAIVCYALDVSGDDLRAVLDLNQTLDEPLLAPASVR